MLRHLLIEHFEMRIEMFARGYLRQPKVHEIFESYFVLRFVLAEFRRQSRHWGVVAFVRHDLSGRTPMFAPLIVPTYVLIHQ